MTAPLAEVTVDTRDGIVVAAISGEVDVSNAESIGTTMREALTNDVRTMIVDLTETDYMDSAGLNLLFHFQVGLRNRQQDLRIVVPAGSPVERTISITGLDRAANVYGSRSEALEA